MTPADLSDLKPLYLIFGSEPMLLQRAVKRLRDRFAQVADLDFNSETFDGESASADDVVAAANTLPFMSDRRLVIVRDADKMSSADLAVLAAYAADPSPETVLVLVATKIARNTKLYKAVEANGVVFEYKAPRRSEYPREVVGLFRERGKTIDLEGAEALVRASGRDLRRLASEVDKVVAFVGERERLTAADVEQVVAETAGPTVFEFLDALGSRDLAMSLRLLGRLLDDGESVHGIQAMTVRHVRSLLNARALLDRRADQLTVARELGMPDWMVRNILRQADRFTAEELTAALIGAARAEGDMKTSRVDPRLAFERWLAATCVRDGRKPCGLRPEVLGL